MNLNNQNLFRRNVCAVLGSLVFISWTSLGFAEVKKSTSQSGRQIEVSSAKDEKISLENPTGSQLFYQPKGGESFLKMSVASFMLFSSTGKGSMSGQSFSYQSTGANSILGANNLTYLYGLSDEFAFEMGLGLYVQSSNSTSKTTTTTTTESKSLSKSSGLSDLKLGLQGDHPLSSFHLLYEFNVNLSTGTPTATMDSSGNTTTDTNSSGGSNYTLNFGPYFNLSDNSIFGVVIGVGGAKNTKTKSVSSSVTTESNETGGATTSFAGWYEVGSEKMTSTTALIFMSVAEGTSKSGNTTTKNLGYSSLNLLQTFIIKKSKSFDLVPQFALAQAFTKPSGFDSLNSFSYGAIVELRFHF